MQTGRADCGSGTGIAVHGRQVAHLHAGGEAELWLGPDAVKRMAAALHGRARLETATVRLRLDTEDDVRIVLSLLSVAIKRSAEPRNGPWCRVVSA